MCDCNRIAIASVRKSRMGGHISCFERGAPLARGAVFLLSRGAGALAWEIHWHGEGV